MLEDNPQIQTVCLCLDNDEAGQTANRRIADKLRAQNISTEILVPIRKDWNEDRQAALAPHLDAGLFCLSETEGAPSCTLHTY